MLELAFGFELINDAASFQNFFRRLTSTTVTFPAGRQFGNACRFGGGGSNDTFDTPVMTLDNKWTNGFGFFCDQIQSSDPQLIAALVRDSDNSVQTTIAIQKGGTPERMRIRVYRGDIATGTVLAETDYILKFGVWYYLEWQVLLHNSIGTVEVRINTNAVIDADTLDTAEQDTNQADTLRFGGVIRSLGTGSLLDDVYILNDIDAGDGDNVDFLGDKIIEGVRPTSDAAAGWAPSSMGSDNFEMVDDATPDDDATYVESTTNNQKDLYGFPNVSHAKQGISGVQLYHLARLTASGSRDIETKVKQGVTEVAGATHTVDQTSYEYSTEILERDPTDDALWTESKLNAVELGVESIP